MSALSLALDIFNFRFRTSLIFDLIFKLYSHSRNSEELLHPVAHLRGVNGAGTLNRERPPLMHFLSL